MPFSRSLFRQRHNTFALYYSLTTPKLLSTAKAVSSPSSRPLGISFRNNFLWELCSLRVSSTNIDKCLITLSLRPSFEKKSSFNPSLRLAGRTTTRGKQLWGGAQARFDVINRKTFQPDDSFECQKTRKKRTLAVSPFSIKLQKDEK
jgi:hypothetical protein